MIKISVGCEGKYFKETKGKLEGKYEFRKKIRKKCRTRKKFVLN